MTEATTTRYGIVRDTALGYDEAIARVKELLKEEGFGVLTEIDVRRTLKEKIDKDVEPYIILGACNPKLAARSLEAEPDIGLLLPCNVIVAKTATGTRVGVANPASFVEFTGNPALDAVADEANERLRRVMEKL